MTTNQDIERVVFEGIKESPAIIESKDGNKILIPIDKLRTALLEAEERGRRQVVEYINTNLMWGRDNRGNLVMDSKHLTQVLEEALTKARSNA